MAAIAPVIGAITSIAQVGLQMGAANYQAQVASMNRDIAMQNASREMTRSQQEEMDVGHRGAGMIGELVASQGASGISLGKGSAPLVRSHAAKLARQDVIRTRAAGEATAYNYLVDAANFKAQADMARAEGRASMLGGFLGAGSSLIGSASSVQNKERFY